MHAYAMSSHADGKILPGVGLCIACYDLVDVHEPFVPPGEGHIRVKGMLGAAASMLLLLLLL